MFLGIVYASAHVWNCGTAADDGEPLHGDDKDLLLLERRRLDHDSRQRMQRRRVATRDATEVLCVFVRGGSSVDTMHATSTFEEALY